MKGTVTRSVLVALCLSFFIAGCSWFQKKGESGTAWNLTSDTLPAAGGKVVTQNWQGQKRDVTVQVDHLAPADRIAGGATTYVVWFKPSQEAPAQNMGAIQPDKNLSGKLTTTTSFENFDVFLTPEPSATVTSPSNKEVMSAQVRGPSQPQ